MESEKSEQKDMNIYLKIITEGNLRKLIEQGICEAIVQYKLILYWKVKNENY